MRRRYYDALARLAVVPVSRVAAVELVQRFPHATAVVHQKAPVHHHLEEEEEEEIGGGKLRGKKERCRKKKKGPSQSACARLRTEERHVSTNVWHNTLGGNKRNMERNRDLLRFLFTNLERASGQRSSAHGTVEDERQLRLRILDRGRRVGGVVIARHLVDH